MNKTNVESNRLLGWALVFFLLQGLVSPFNHASAETMPSGTDSSNIILESPAMETPTESPETMEPKQDNPLNSLAERSPLIMTTQAKLTEPTAAGDISLFAVPPLPYMSDPGYVAVLLNSSSNNGKTRAHILWVQGGQVLVAVNSISGVQSMTLAGQASDDMVSLPVGSTLSVDSYTSISPTVGLSGNTSTARWQIFSFPISVLSTSGTYPISIISGGGAGSNVNTTTTVAVANTTANLNKMWYGGAASTISFQLYRKIGEAGTKTAVGSPISLTRGPSNTANYQWTQLPLSNASSQRYTYFVEETTPGPYEVSYNTAYNETSRVFTFNVVNVFKIPISASKVWSGGANPRPAVTFQLYRNVGSDAGTTVGNPVVLDGIVDANELTPWVYTWPAMASKTTAGADYSYYVVETGVPANYTPDPVTDLTVTNTFVSPLADVTATKLWNGGTKPPVTFQLYRKIGTAEETVGSAVSLDGVVDTFERTAWKYTWMSLPTHRQSDGQVYTYFVRETMIPPYYTADPVDDLFVTNSYASPLSDVTATKVWVGGTNRPGVTFQLYRTVGQEAGVAVGTPVVLDGVVDGNELTPWDYTWKNLPTHRQVDGLIYTYYVKETAGPMSYTADTIDDLTVTNTIKTRRVEIRQVVTGNYSNPSQDFAFTFGSHTFTLRHGGSQVYTMAVEPSTVSLTEASDGYTTTIQVNDGGSLSTISPENGVYAIPITPGTDDLIITVTNHRATEIPTGRSFDTLPFRILLAAAMLGIIGLNLRSRKKQDEQET